MKDGIYLQVFAIKDGQRYDVKIMPMNELSVALTNGMMDGLYKATCPSEVDVDSTKGGMNMKAIKKPAEYTAIQWRGDNFWTEVKDTLLDAGWYSYLGEDKNVLKIGTDYIVDKYVRIGSYIVITEGKLEVLTPEQFELCYQIVDSDIVSISRVKQALEQLKSEALKDLPSICSKCIDLAINVVEICGRSEGDNE